MTYIFLLKMKPAKGLTTRGWNHPCAAISSKPILKTQTTEMFLRMLIMASGGISQSDRARHSSVTGEEPGTGARPGCRAGRAPRSPWATRLPCTCVPGARLGQTQTCFVVTVRE